MDIYNKNNKFLNYFLILLSLILLVFFAKPKYAILQESLDTKQTLSSSLDNLNKKHLELNLLKNDILLYNQSKLDEIDKKIKSSSWVSERLKFERIVNIKKYINPVNEDEMLKYIYSYFENQNSLNQSAYSTKSIITSFNLSKPKINEFWFRESSLNLSLYVANEDDLIKFMNFLSWNNSKYKFFFNSLSYPIEKPDESFVLNFPLRVFYK